MRQLFPIFLFETLARIGSSIFSGTLVSCLILGRLENIHIMLLAVGALLASLGYPLLSRLQLIQYPNNAKPLDQDDHK